MPKQLNAFSSSPVSLVSLLFLFSEDWTFFAPRVFATIRSAFRQLNLEPLKNDSNAGAGLARSGAVQHPTILVVDDEFAVRQVTKTMLECLGFSVLTAADGRQGIDVFSMHANEVCAAVIDQTMPGLSGTETMERLLTIRPDLKIIIISGGGQGGQNDLAGELAPAGYLRKPFAFDVLAAKLKSVLQTCG